MKTLPRLTAIALMGVGLVIMAVGGVNLMKANQGLTSLDAVYEAQNVELTYNDAGELIDRGETAGAQAILSLLQDDWKFPVNQADLDAGDPLVNTPTELMYQYATITYHVLHGTHTVILAEDVEYNGEVFEAGTYEVPVDGRYWTDFDRAHPLDAQVREAAWGGAHGLLGSISSGVAADYQAGFAHFAGWRTILVGFAFVLGGFGLLTLTLQKKEEEVGTATRERELVATA